MTLRLSLFCWFFWFTRDPIDSKHFHQKLDTRLNGCSRHWIIFSPMMQVHAAVPESSERWSYSQRATSRKSHASSRSRSPVSDEYRISYRIEIWKCRRQNNNSKVLSHCPVPIADEIFLARVLRIIKLWNEMVICFWKISLVFNTCNWR